MSSRYMTNIDRSHKALIEEAAKTSGFNVEYRDHPMPRDALDDLSDGYNPDTQDCGSVYTNEPDDRDHSPFWDIYDRLLNSH
jgi:hypothetical protein